MSENIIVVSEENYEKEVVQSEVPVLIDFWAPWCGPCMALLPVLEALAPEYQGQIKFVKINGDDNVALMEKFGVRGLPTMFLLKRGECVASPKARTRTRLQMELDGLLD
jgi:thioredoxin 1